MDDTALTPAAHRQIRWLDGHEAAFAGALVTDGEQLRVRVAADDLPDALWAYSDAQHVAGVRDVVRRGSGHDALLPWCAEPVDVFLARRASAEQPLSTGETVTLVGSLLRGVGEVGDEPLRGRWWLTDDSRPLFVPGEGSPCGATAAEIIGRVRDACTDRMLDRLLTEIAGGIEEHRTVRRSGDRWEHELTQLAAPRTLARDVFAPERVVDNAVHRERRSHPTLRNPERDDLRERWRARIAGGVERAVVWLRERRPRRVRSEQRAVASHAGRGRMLIVGAAAAAAVLLGGMLWPGDDETSATESVAQRSPDEPAPGEPKPGVATSEPPADEGAAKSPPPADRTRQPEGEASSGQTVPEQAAQLLERIGACQEQDDATCADAVVEGAGEVVLRRLDGGAQARGITPVEDYGDIAVVRLAAVAELGEQMLVLVRQKDGWLVRDVYDVADQPSVAG